jgi:Transposase DDE domain
MITGFADFCLWAYVTIDDLWPTILPPGSRPGPAPRPSDPELVTMLLVGECCGWDVETECLARWQAHCDLFPHLPERSRFNRRRRNLAWAINRLRRRLLADLDLALDRQCVIDSLPIPVLQWQHVPHAGSRADWQAADASYGRVPSKGQAIFGYKLHLLVTANGVIRDFELVSAWHTDIVAGAEVLAEQRDVTVLGDKGYVSAPIADALAASRGVTLLAIPRANQRQQWPQVLRAAVMRLRQIVETVNDQLTEQLHIQINHAYSCWGLCARLYTKLTAHSLCVYLNRRTGYPHPLQIKHWTLAN